MRILLIAPASGHWRGLGRKRLFNGRTFRFSMLSLLSVAALTPEGAAEGREQGEAEYRLNWRDRGQGRAGKGNGQESQGRSADNFRGVHHGFTLGFH